MTAVLNPAANYVGPWTGVRNPQAGGNGGNGGNGQQPGELLGQIAGAGSGSSTASMVLPVTQATTTTGTLIGCGKVGAGQTISSIDDTQGNTWTVDAIGTGTAQRVLFFRCEPAQALGPGDTITLTLGGATTWSAVVAEFTGRGYLLDINQLSANIAAGLTFTAAAARAIASTPQLIVFGFAISGAAPITGQVISATSPALDLLTPPTVPQCGLAAGIADTVLTPTVTWTWTLPSAGTSWGLLTYALAQTVISGGTPASAPVRSLDAGLPDATFDQQINGGALI